MNKWRHSLRGKTILALLLSGLAAFFAFWGLQELGYRVLDNYFATSDFEEKSNNKCLDQFQGYVTKESVKATEVELLEQWLDSQRTAYIALAVYRDGQELYTSAYLIDDSGEEEFLSYYPESEKREFVFADGAATVYLAGYFDYQYYEYASYLEIVLAILLFLLLFLGFMRRPIRYIVQLEQEIKILETGGLEREITIQGKDELASLADGLNQMRLSLLENIQREEEASRANYRLVVSMAHDLRTPLTALLLYLDLLHNEKYSDQEQMKSYVEKCLAKATQIKRMSNQLFERFLLSGEAQVRPDPPRKVQAVLEDMLSDMVIFLEDNYFAVQSELSWPEGRIAVVTDYMGRILDNISSNILKYADRTKPVKLWLGEENGRLLVRFENQILVTEEKEESTGVGNQNIHLMIRRMGGSSRVEEKGGNYRITLEFPLHK